MSATLHHYRVGFPATVILSVISETDLPHEEIIAKAKTLVEEYWNADFQGFDIPRESHTENESDSPDIAVYPADEWEGYIEDHEEVEQ